MKIYYQTYGDKKNRPLLFLHGFLGSHADWEDVINLLSDKFYCLSIDLPGHGQTKTDNEQDYLTESIGASILLLLNELNLKKIDLIGYSMGGRLGFYLAVNYPEIFKKVVLESATPGLKTEAQKQQRRLHDKIVAENIFSLPFSKFIDDWYSQPLFLTMGKSSDKFSELLKRRYQNDPGKLALSLKMMGTGAMPSLWADLDKIKSDILLIVGRKDSKFCKTADEVSKLIPCACHEIVNDAGHNVHFEQKNQFVEIVSKFLLDE